MAPKPADQFSYKICKLIQDFAFLTIWQFCRHSSGSPVSFSRNFFTICKLIQDFGIFNDLTEFRRHFLSQLNRFHVIFCKLSQDFGNVDGSSRIRTLTFPGLQSIWQNFAAILLSTVWKIRQKQDHSFDGKFNIFFVKSTFLLKKLLKSSFHGNFWAWSRFIAFFHTVLSQLNGFHVIFFLQFRRQQQDSYIDILFSSSYQVLLNRYPSSLVYGWAWPIFIPLTKCKHWEIILISVSLKQAGKFTFHYCQNPVQFSEL